VSLATRKITYRLYPRLKQIKRLEQVCELHRQLYNAALEQRRDAYQRCGMSLSFSDQCKELTQLRHEFPEYKELNAQSSQVTLKRLDIAFQGFFRRVRENARQAGFPRFKSKDRFKGFGYKSHGDGFKVFTDGKNGSVRLSGIGTIKMRGKARVLGKITTAEIIKKGDFWYISITVHVQAQRKSGKKAMGLDWGVETFATLALSDGSYDQIENPRHLRKALKDLKWAQKNLSRKKIGSKNRTKAKRKVVRIHQKVAHQRKEFLHQNSANLVKESGLIATEELKIKNLTAFGGSHKKGLNREILSTAPARFISMLKYKAEEAGTQWIEIPTQKIKPSQTCSRCGERQRKELSERSHACKVCGLHLTRDQNSARVSLNWALTGRPWGWEPSRCGEIAVAVSAKQETPAITTQVVWQE
jgi:putative transposase